MARYTDTQDTQDALRIAVAAGRRDGLFADAPCQPGSEGIVERIARDYGIALRGREAERVERAYRAAFNRHFAAPDPDPFTLGCGEAYTSPNYPQPLTVVGRSWPYGATLADRPNEVYLSADGRRFVTEFWHQGESTDLVYVEVYRSNGHDFHGYIDRYSRLLVQAG
jgi:hypothetical protein